jgi:hypothetical protein
MCTRAKTCRDQSFYEVHAKHAQIKHVMDTQYCIRIFQSTKDEVHFKLVSTENCTVNCHYVHKMHGTLRPGSDGIDLLDKMGQAG